MWICESKSDQYLLGLKNTAKPPGPKQTNTAKKLVNNKAHPYHAPVPTDQRGPCPGLNTLAKYEKYTISASALKLTLFCSHGYINRTGIVTPQEVVAAVQDGV